MRLCSKPYSVPHKPPTTNYCTYFACSSPPFNQSTFCSRSNIGQLLLQQLLVSTPSQLIRQTISNVNCDHKERIGRRWKGNKRENIIIVNISKIDLAKAKGSIANKTAKTNIV